MWRVADAANCLGRASTAGAGTHEFESVDSHAAPALVLTVILLPSAENQTDETGPVASEARPALKVEPPIRRQSDWANKAPGITKTRMSRLNGSK